MGTLMRISCGLVVGAAVGAGLVLVLTPRSGTATRQLIQERFESILAEGREAAANRRIELTTRFEGMVQSRSGK